MDKSYDPKTVENRWYAVWEEHGYFRPPGTGEPYTIMLPPPNVTGRLHMGHAFQDTIMDALIRYHRMRGRDALWQGGTDHAGIATQMVVERQLAAEGTSRHELGREGFLERVWAFKEQSGGHITGQLRRLGASIDWDHERFTMDSGYSEAVTEHFVRLYNEGLIYRGQRLVNWDPVLLTALSDLEVANEEEVGHLWHMRYPRADGQGHVIVATTRPETMLGDTAVAVHPDDERYADLVGKSVRLPLTDRELPVIADEYVDPEFGTGCLKITPAHDFNDYEVGRRHGQEPINTLNPDATLNNAVPERYRGLDRFEARKRVVADLEAEGLLEKTEKHRLTVPRGDRSGAVLEPYLTDQWFVRAEPLAQRAMEVVRAGRIRFVPDNWTKTYYEWLNNIQDWCISRQLWWGHRIPAWYDGDGNVYVGRTEEEVREKYASRLAPDTPLERDEDVFDTWFSSALWPFATLGWPEETPRLDRYYPTSVLVTGFDIIFFWVARMVMAGLHFMDEVPFRDVYIHGLIRDAQGQKMSKSKGNVLDPIDLIDGIQLEDLVAKRTEGLMQPQKRDAIERATRKEFPDGIPAFGADALRFTFAALATTGRDIRLDLGRVEGYRNFCNKLWNAARFVLMNCEGHDAGASRAEPNSAARWIRHRFNETVRSTHERINEYRFDLASHALYEFTWNEYCDWYVELAKHDLQAARTEEERAAVRQTLLEVLEGILRLLHPIMPFITEEIWQRVAPVAGIEGKTVMLRPQPEPDDALEDAAAAADLAWLQDVVSGVRQVRSEMNVPPGKALPLKLQGGGDGDRERAERFASYILGLARVDTIDWAPPDAALDDCATSLAGRLKLAVPMAGLIDKEAEVSRLEKEIGKRRKDLEQSETKLAKESFVNNAPAEIVEKERSRAADHRAALEQLTEQLERIRAL
jgi:valyl-tRNA synthetase